MCIRTDYCLGLSVPVKESVVVSTGTTSICNYSRSEYLHNSVDKKIAVGGTEDDDP